MSKRTTYDFVTERTAVRDLKYATETFLLNPAQWRSFRTSHSLPWRKLRFTRANRRHIPREPGIYAFVVEHAGDWLPAHGYIMYFGITGPTPRRHLWTRYGEYLREKTKGRRLSVQLMLNDYEDDLFFHYVPLNLTRSELKALETALIDAVQPPVNEKDFSAEIMRRRKAL